jgi:hypothetical protein
VLPLLVVELMDWNLLALGRCTRSGMLAMTEIPRDPATPCWSV